ncbi:MAG: tRNA (guanosine(37)-N1)-methyltransferase TrmD [Candidatus Atribacteria bacterium]|nr:tRNA (guanosine(37)-N1)-methyltransferase TrmD [Candidatus Atribacteria bacterium]
MEITILTIFPEMFVSPFSESIIKRAIEKKIIEINVVDIRNFTRDKHRSVDDYSYGGGPGMVLKPEPIIEAIKDIEKSNDGPKNKIIITSAQGKVFNQDSARNLANYKKIIFVCGRYEGIDERVFKLLDAEEISIGDYVMTGGEIATMVMVDVIARMIPGVLGKEESMKNDSFYHGLLDYPHYTRPESYRRYKVPKVLLSGNHHEIEKWRIKQSLLRTMIRRPDLLANKKYSKEELEILMELEADYQEKEGEK